jgi:hypothetical protein
VYGSKGERALEAVGRMPLPAAAMNIMNIRDGDLSGERSGLRFWGRLRDAMLDGQMSVVARLMAACESFDKVDSL